MTFPELIIFDCDGVLVDSEIISNRVLAEHLSNHGYPISARDCRERFIGGSLPKIVEEIGTEGIRLPADFISSLRLRDVMAFKAELQPIPGIKQALAKLPHKKCVASSGPPEKIQSNLEVTGLIEDFTPHLYSGYNVANSKPAPDLFLHVAAEFAVSPSQCLVIEDSKFGVMAAKAAKMTVFGYVGGSHCDDQYTDQLSRQEPDHIFSEMESLPDLVAKWATIR